MASWWLWDCTSAQYIWNAHCHGCQANIQWVVLTFGLGTDIICCKIRMSSFTPKVKGSSRGHKVNSVLTGNVYCRLRRRYIHTTHHFESSDVDTPETRTRSDVVLLYIAIPETSIVDFKTRMSCHASPKVHLGFTRLIQWTFVILLWLKRCYDRMTHFHGY